MMIQNTAELRSQNKMKILEFLRSGNVSTKRDIADALNLSFSTVSNLCNQLVQEEILEWRDSDQFNGGRIPKLLAFNARGRYAACIDMLNLKRVHIYITDLLGGVIWQSDERLSVADDYESALSALADEFTALLDKNGADRRMIIGVGVAIPGILDYKTCEVFNSTEPLLNGKRLPADLSAKLNLSVCAENESNLMAIAALKLIKTETKAKDLIYVYFGEGLGVGIVQDEQLVRGHRGFAGEIAHMPIGRGDYECYCGMRGCIETEIALPGFIRKYNEAAPRFIPTKATMEGQWQEFCSRAEAGDEAALKVIAENGALIGTLMSVLCNLLDPQIIVAGGDICALEPLLRPHIEKSLRERSISKEVKLDFLTNAQDLITKGCGELVVKNWKP